MQSEIGKKFQSKRLGSGSMNATERKAFAMAARALLEQGNCFDDAEFMYRTLNIAMPTDLVLKNAKEQWQQKNYAKAVEAMVIAGDPAELEKSGVALRQHEDPERLGLALNCFAKINAYEKIVELAEHAFALAKGTEETASELGHVALDAFQSAHAPPRMIALGDWALGAGQLQLAYAAFEQVDAKHKFEKLGDAYFAEQTFSQAARCYNRAKSEEGLLNCALALAEVGKPMEAWEVYDHHREDALLAPLDVFEEIAGKLLDKSPDDALWLFNRIAEQEIRRRET